MSVYSSELAAGLLCADQWRRLIRSCLQDDDVKALSAIEEAQDVAEVGFAAIQAKVLKDLDCRSLYKDFERLKGKKSSRRRSPIGRPVPSKRSWSMPKSRSLDTNTTT